MLKSLYVDPRCRSLIADFNAVQLEHQPSTARPPRYDHWQLLPEYVKQLRSLGETEAADEIVDLIFSELQDRD